MNLDIYHLSEKYLKDLPTKCVGQADSLKLEGTDQRGQWRVWLCRCGKEDGMPINNTVTVERYDPVSGRWYNETEYEALP